MMKTLGNKIFGKLTLFFTFVFCFTFVGVISTVQAIYAAGESTPTDSVYILETGKTEATKMVGGDNALLEIADNDGTGKAVFDDTTGVLTLTNFDCQGILVADGNTQKDIIINLVGTNTITAGYKKDDFIPNGIKSQRGRITIQGDGTLNIVKGSEYFYGIYTHVSGGDDGSVTIKGNASVSIENAGYGIVANGNISIEDNANFSAVLEEVTSYNEYVSNGLQVANGAKDGSTITINTTGNVFIDNSVNSASSTIYPIYNYKNTSNYATITNVGKLELKYYNTGFAWDPKTFDDLKITNSMTEGNYLRRDILDPTTKVSNATIKSKSATDTIYTVKVSDGTAELVDGVRQQKWNTYQYIEGETAIAFADIKIAGNIPFYGWLVYEGTPAGLTSFDAEKREAEFTVNNDVSIVAMYKGFTGTPAFTQDTGATTGKITGWTKLIDDAQVLVVPVDDNGIPQWNTSYDYCYPTYISNSNYVGLTTETQTYISTLPAGKYRLAYSNNNLSTDRYAYSDVFEVTYTLTFIDKPTSSLLTYNGSEQQGIADNDAYTISGTYKATDANTYTATVTLKDGYKWSDGTTDKTISVDWTINKKSIDIPTAKTGLVYNGTPQQGIEAGEGYTFVREHIQTNAGGYVAVVSLENNNYVWKDNTTTDKEIYWQIARKPIDKPTANTGFVYDGFTKTGVNEGTGYTLTGHEQTNAGTHYAVATLDNNHMWKDGSIDDYSIAWSIAKADKSAPTGVTGVGCTTSANNNGKLVGVSEIMEYRLKGVSEWTSVPNATSTIYDLVAGTYEVRFEEQANFNASAVVEVVINEYNHVCGSLTKTDNVEATHFTEGKEAYWTCSCGKHYEDENGTKPINNINTWGIVTTTNHELSENWTFDETHHWKDCTIEGCENKDSYEIHKGGAATCTEQAICEVCGQKYGDLTAHNYNNEWSSNETNHWKECTCGDKKNNEEHTYGEWTTVREATETETGSKERTCTVCSYKETETISVNTHVHSYSTDWKFDVISHYKDCACGEKVDIANHDYSDDTDDTCNTCGFKRTINNPTPTPTPDPIEKDGLSGGAIAAIVVSGVLVLSLGGFSVFWFVIKKKSFKDLIKIFKK